MHEIPPFVLDRARSQEPVFTADEVDAWPDGLLSQLVAIGVVTPTNNARSISCDGCGDTHVEVVQFVESPPDSGLRAYIPCPENGRVRIPLERLRCWSVNLKKALAEQRGGEPTVPVEASEAARPVEKRSWPDPCENTVAKVWTRKDGTVCLGTKTGAVRDGAVEFAPTIAGVLTNQMRFIQLLCFRFPNTATLAEVIEQVYPDESSAARRDPQVLKKTLRKLRSLVSDVRIKKLSKAGLNPDIVPSLSIDTTIDTGIGLRLAHLHRLDDKDLDESDEAL